MSEDKKPLSWRECFTCVPHGQCAEEIYLGLPDLITKHLSKGYFIPESEARRLHALDEENKRLHRECEHSANTGLQLSRSNLDLLERIKKFEEAAILILACDNTPMISLEATKSRLIKAQELLREAMEDK